MGRLVFLAASSLLAPAACLFGFGESAKKGEVSEACAWIRGSTWHWNNWRDVQFRSDGTFVSPTPDCQRGECSWSATGDVVSIQWGDAGMHTVTVDHGRRTMRGKRESDGDPVQARWLSGGNEEPSSGDGVASDESDACVLTEHDDAYDVLGVDPEADEGAIKKAFRKLSRTFHPDKYRGDDKAGAECKFNKMRMAYEILSDEEKRFLYDSDGLEAAQKHEKNEGGGGGAMDPFSMFFGGGGGNSGGSKGKDFNAELSVDLADMYNGNEQAVSFKRRVVCRGCGPKSGGSRRKKANCDGCTNSCPPETRMVQRQMAPGFVVQQQEQVPSQEKCKTEEKTISAVIEKGMADGAQLRFERMSEQTPGVIPGDVILNLRQKPHPIFTRNGDDLHTKLEITLKEALTGFRKEIEHLDGHKVEIGKDPKKAPGKNKREIVRPLQVVKIMDEGMPVHEVPSQHGALHVEFTVRLPSKLTDEQRKVLNEILP